MADQRLILKFEKELKHRVSQKTTAKIADEKVLLESFKHYDINKQEFVDFKTFKKVMAVRLGISLFNDEELLMIFDYYSREDPNLNYREFISKMYGTNVQLSVRLESESARDTKSFTGNKYDVIDEEKQIRKMLEVIMFRLRRGPLYSFLKFYKDLKDFDDQDTGCVSINHFTHTLRKNTIEISGEDTESVWRFFNSKGEGMEYERLIECFTVNFRNERLDAARKMFDRFDFMQTNRINLNMLKELFNARQHFNVRTGRQTLDEVQLHFEIIIDTFGKLIKGDLVINSQKFLTLLKFISAHVENNQDFVYFCESCFRFNEIPRQNDSVYSGRDKISYRNKNPGNDEASQHSSLKVNHLLQDIDEQISKKGYRAFIQFYKVLRGNDYDNDSHLFLKDFEKCIKEARIQLSTQQVQAIYKQYSDDGIRMNYGILLQSLVPPFNDERTERIKELYENLFETEKADSLTFIKIQTAFNPRGHPDFKTGKKPDYELKTEFNDALESFLICYQGNYIKVSLYAFIRFFEFFGRNWSIDYFNSILSQAFKLPKNRSVYEGSLRESAKDSMFGKKNNKTPLKYYEEFAQHGQQENEVSVKSKVQAPFYTEKMENEDPMRESNAFKKKEQPKDTGRPYYIDKDLPSQYDKPNTNLKLVEEFNKTKAQVESRHRQQSPPKSTTQSRLQVFPKQNVMNSPRSPDDGSVISDAHYEHSVKILNEKLQETNKSKSNMSIVNVGSVMRTYTTNCRKTFNVPLVLQVEYDLTNKSDNSGNIDFEVFSSILEKHNLLSNINDDQLHALYIQNLNHDNKLHVQTFCNNLRGQMNEQREEATIALFDKITPKNLDELPVNLLRSSFIPANFKFGRYNSNAEKQEMFEGLVDLFVCLNVAIKNKTEIDLDDFLYMFDNFSFFYEDVDEYLRFLKVAFK